MKNCSMKPVSSSKPILTITERFAQVKREITIACKNALRSHDSIQLVAVSKGQPFSAIEELYRLGQRDFAESYAQELAHKIKESQEKAMSDIIWHFIGGIQSNKIKIIKEAQ